MRASQFGGCDPAAFRDNAQLRADALARRRRDAAHDATHVSSTRLRAARVTRLAEIVALGEMVGVDVPRVLDGAAAVQHDIAPGLLTNDDIPLLPSLQSPRFCYVCKKKFLHLHHFYDALCPRCASFNWEKRTSTCDASGRVFIVTGARVKIGFHVTLKLLRAGARVIATSRFPTDLARRLAAESDASEWADRVSTFGLDLRHVGATEAFATFLLATEERIDGLINNACQTVRRPPAYYAAIVGREEEELTGLAHQICCNGGREPSLAIYTTTLTHPSTTLSSSATAALLPLLSTDIAATATAATLFPIGAVDAAGSQLDLRKTNSWSLRLGEIETGEAAETLLINTLAPFILAGRLRGRLGARAAGALPPRWLAVRGLQPLTVAQALEGGPSLSPRESGNVLGEVSPPSVLLDIGIVSWVINVSAVEGKFARESKQPSHPHTNMAKAALNMMTRTCARDYACAGIFMNSVDTGWINDENPGSKAERIAVEHNWVTPLDEEDAAARILDPVFSGIREGVEKGFVFGAFLKDYHTSEW